MEKIPFTQAGLDKTKSELHQLKNVERQQVIRAIADAREHGDLSENAEYHAARERQSFIEGRIKELEDVHLAQALNYLKAYKLKVGLLINFGSKSLTFKRLVL